MLSGLKASLHVIKVDFHFSEEARQRFELVTDQTWQLKTLAMEKISRAWTQYVYEVFDAPRYCSTGC